MSIRVGENRRAGFPRLPLRHNRVAFTALSRRHYATIAMPPRRNRIAWKTLANINPDEST